MWDGTVTIQPKKWDYDSDTGVCSAELEEDIFALLYKNDLLTSARWPNSKWSDKSCFDNQNWRQCPESERGTIVDDALAEANLNFTGIFNERDRACRRFVIIGPNKLYILTCLYPL